MRQALSEETKKRIADRFWSTIVLLDENSCWLWTGRLSPKGYGIVCVERMDYRAHRVAWELVNGPIPEGILVCHSCDTPPCCNPLHLFLGTNKDNTMDCLAKGRLARGERHGRHKIAQRDVETILALRAQGVFQRVIAAQFGIDQTTVSLIEHGKIWCP